MSELVWYAAYGSNLLGARFLTYLTGGVAPHRPSRRPHPGARNPEPPIDTRGWEVSHRLFFAASSKNWGGGALAWLDPRPGTDHQSLVRLWLVTVEQFEDIFRQENGLPIPAEDEDDVAPITLDGLAPGSPIDALDRWYGRLLHLGDGPDRHPVVTFTGANPDRHPLGPAHPAYLRTVGLGLMETFAFDAEGAARLVAEYEGNAGRVDWRALADDLTAWADST